MLLIELHGRGYTGGYSTLARYLRPLRHIEAPAVTALALHARAPAVQQVAGWITGLPGHLDPADAARFQEIRRRCPELDAAVRRVAGFAGLKTCLATATPSPNG